MTTQRLFPSTNGPGAPTAATGGWLLGVIFSVTGGLKWLNGYYHWVPAGGDTTPAKFALWNRYSTTQQSLVPNSTITSGTLTAGAWNFTALPQPVQLAPGALYVAAKGWTAVNGIPNTTAQFGTGDPLAAGIVQGFLTAWSATSGSNTFPAANVNYNLGQMLFSNVLGADPSVNMPNNGSGDDNLWMDVQVSDTAPTGYSGSYRFKPNQADLGAYALDTANNFTLGMQFSLSQPCAVNRVWFYSQSGATQLPTWAGVFSAPGGSIVAQNASPSWSGAAGSGWVSTTVSGTLPSGAYKVAVCNGAGSPVVWNAAVANYWSTGFGGNGLVAGPLSAPNNASALSPGQDTYNAGAAPTYPATNAGPFDYGLDIEVTPAAGGLLMASGII